MIAILIALLFPALRKAREAARRAACLGNLRQMQIAWQTYADEHNGYIVNGMAWHLTGSPKNDGTPWLIARDDRELHAASPRTYAHAEALMRTGALAPYAGNLRVYLCPSRYRLLVCEPKAEWLSSYNIVISMNVRDPVTAAAEDRRIRAVYNTGRTVLHVRKTSELVDPGPSSRMVFLDEGAKWDLAKVFACVYGFGSIFSYDSTPLATHHSDGTTMSFADGHSEYWRWRDPVTIAWGHWREKVDKVSGVDASSITQPIAVGRDNPDHSRVHKAIWGKGP